MPAAYNPASLSRKKLPFIVTCYHHVLPLSSWPVPGGGFDRHQQCDVPAALLSLRLPLFKRDQLHRDIPPRCAHVQGQSSQWRHLADPEHLLNCNVCVCLSVCVWPSNLTTSCCWSWWCYCWSRRSWPQPRWCTVPPTRVSSGWVPLTLTTGRTRPNITVRYVRTQVNELQNDVTNYLGGISPQLVIYAINRCGSLLQQQISNGTLQDFDKDRNWKAVMVQMAQWAPAQRIRTTKIIVKLEKLG